MDTINHFDRSINKINMATGKLVLLGVIGLGVAYFRTKKQHLLPVLRKRGGSKTVLVTGGAGYIGSHTCIELLQEGYDAVVVDNLSNSSRESINRVRKITNCEDSRLEFIKLDLCDKDELDYLFARYNFHSVIHFAGLKAVGESVAFPLKYYSNNLIGSLNLLNSMNKHNCRNLIFSSSATVYGDQPSPLTEESTVGQNLTNPYGQTKYMIEQFLRDVTVSPEGGRWNIIILRYFNPVGAHSSGLIGEDPAGLPNNLVPYIQRVAVGKLPHLNVFGNDYETKDGTGVRDYIHVVDLAKGHLAALQKLNENCRFNIYNLGTGKGQSVLDVIGAFEKASGKEIQYKIAPRRPGDLSTVFADSQKAERELNWRAEKTIDDMCQDSWRWISKNPDGYMPTSSSSEPK